MLDFFRRLLDTSGFPARWRCGVWSPFEGWLHIVSDTLVFLSYTAIPIALFIIVRRRKETSFPVIYWLFAAFIFSCGVTHAIEAAIFWWPAYRLSGLVKSVTAGVSMVTAVALIRVLPQAIALPGVRRAHEELGEAFARERALRDELTRAHETLEHRTSQLAVRERKLRNAVGAAKACACGWDVESGKVTWEIGFADAMRAAGIEWRSELTDWSALLGPESAAGIRDGARQLVEPEELLYWSSDLAGYEGVWKVVVAATVDPEVRGRPRTMSGMLGLRRTDHVSRAAAGERA